jgi:hypothetical protein
MRQPSRQHSSPMGRPSPMKDPTIEAAKITLIGIVFAAILTLGGDIATREAPPPPRAPVAVNCTAELERFDRYIGADPTKVTSLTAKGADGVAPLERDTGAKACGIDGDDLRAMVDKP